MVSFDVGRSVLYLATLCVDHFDGLCIENQDWRFNLRKSNAEPLVRLNVEARGDADFLAAKKELLRVIENLST